MLSEIILTI